MPRHALVAVLLFCALGTATSCAGRAVNTAPQKGPQVLDPLTADERSSAEKLVRSDARAKELLGDRAVVAALEFLAMKGGTSDEPVRHADLLFARPDADYGVRAIVRLGADAAVVEFTRVDRRSVPVVETEVQEAWKIALADAAYSKQIARDPAQLKVEALRLYTEDRSDPCFSGRCLYLMVRDGKFYVSAASVVVDLATKRILAERNPR
jgi:hypothetical protein